MTPLSIEQQARVLAVLCRMSSATCLVNSRTGIACPCHPDAVKAGDDCQWEMCRPSDWQAEIAEEKED